MTEPGGAGVDGSRLAMAHSSAMADNVVSVAPSAPIVLGANLVEHFYRGGRAISQLRGIADAGERQPEDWVAATVSRFGMPSVGPTVLDGGVLLRDAVAADPEAWLGPAHVRRFGVDTELLVKLIDAGERLPVHCHPDRAFARSHLDCRHGKTEAWVIVETAGEDPSVYLGFRRAVDGDQLAAWVRRQDTDALLGVMNRLPVKPGDAVLVPAGLPHAIGEGLLIVELQEPADLSVLLEWEGYALDGARDGHLELGYDVALRCVDRSGWDADRLRRLRGPNPGRGGRRLLPAEADEFFRAEWIVGGAGVTLDAGFSVLVVVEGEGELTDAEGRTLRLRRGMTVLMPWGAGDAVLRGALDVVRCRPPDPAWGPHAAG